MADQHDEPADDDRTIIALIIGSVLICAMAAAGLTFAVYLLTIP